MPENIRETMASMSPHISNVDRELMAIYQTTVPKEGEQTNLDHLAQLSNLVSETHLVLSSMMAHYQDAITARKQADEAISESGISAETALGQRIKDSAVQAANAMDAAADSRAVYDFLHKFTEDIIEYKKIEGSQFLATGDVRTEIDGCSASLDSFTTAFEMIEGILDV